MTRKIFEAKLILLGFNCLNKYNIVVYSKNLINIYMHKAPTIIITPNKNTNSIESFRSYVKALEYLTDD